ncbi:MAG: tandem-95 repeat protein, partial [Caulobacteraceae bacterium]
TWGVASHRITAAGQLVAGPDTVVNTTTTDQQHSPAITALTGGDYVITWSSYTHDGSDWGVYGQRFNADGTRDGQEFLVNTLTDSSQIYPSVAGLSDGGFVIAWQTFTGADADNSDYGIAGQRYNAAGQPVGGEFLINGIGYQGQSQVNLVAAPDGGFVVAWTSYQADGSSNGLVARRFDAAGNATEPYGDDVLVNTYSLNDQSAPALAMLDRGFVAVWHSQGQDGSGYSIEMQRFQGQGLEPPPLVVDAAHGGDNANDLIFSTLQEALDAAEDGDTVILKGGTYNLSATAVVDVDDLRIKNAAGETVVINGPAGGPALQVGSGLNISLRGDAVERLVFNAGSGAAAAVDLLGTNSGTEILRVTINANGQYGLRFGGGQNGVTVSDSTFGGTASAALVLVRGTASGVAASTGVNVLDSLFTGGGGSGLVTEATGGQILENVFSGAFAEGFAALVAWAGGGDIQDNTFSGPGAGAWFYDLANAYAESTFIGQNAFPAGWTWVQERNGVLSTLKEALATAQAGDTIQATAGDYASETGLTVADDNLTINAPAGATGIVLALGVGVATVTFNDAAAIDVTGNSAANIVHAGSGADSVHGAAGNDQLNGRDGADQLFGDAGDDVLNGGGGDDVLQGGADNDRYVVSVGEGHDTVTDASGAADVLALYSTNSGGGDSLVLSGAAGSTTATFNGDATANVTATGIEAVEVTLDNNDGVILTGAVGASSVRIVGGTGANVIDASGLTSATAITFTGGRGADSFTGSAGLNDTVDYSAETDSGAVTVNLAAGTATDTNGAADTLSGVENVITGAGADSITGSSVANRIEAGAGNDSIAGGAGRDSFVFRAGFGQDTISDFSPSNEILRFDAAVFANVAAVLAAATASGGDTVITAGANTLTLTGVTLAQLGAWNIDILGGNDAPTLRAGAPSATLREVGQGVAGTASSTVALTADDVDGTVSYDAAALAADGWVQSPAGVWTKAGVYGQAVLTVASNNVLYTLDNARPATQALQTGQTVTETFTVPVVDDGGLTATRPVTFSIGGSNDAPVGVADTGTAVEAGVVAGSNAIGNVLTNDTDVDAGDSKTVSAITGGTVGSALNGTYGALTLNADGSYSYAVNNANSSVQALRTAAQTLTDSFTYTVRDAAGASSTTTLTITIQGANDAPVAVADTGIANEAGVAAGANATGNVLTNDTDVDAGDSKSVSALSGGTVGSALTGTYGALTLNADGTYAYVVDNANAAVNALRTTANTLTDAFTYTVTDAAGATSSTTLTITIRGTNDAPVAVADTGTAVEAGTSAGSNASGNLVTNDTDVDTGDAKTVTAFSQGASNGTLGSGLAGAYGTLTVAANGTWTYVVNNANPTVQALRLAGETLTETFNYTMRDTAGATSASTLTVTIQGANDAPVGVNDAGSATEAGVAAGVNASGNVLTNDTDVDAGDSKTVSALSGGTVGSALNGAYGALTLNADGTYSYAVDNANAAVNALRLSTDTLTDSFTYTVRDTAGATSTATLTITVHGANDAPVGVNDTGTAVEAGTAAGSNASGNVLTNDSDVDTGDARTVSALSGGTVGAALAGAYGSLTLNADGTYSYVVNNANEAVGALRTASDTLTDVFTYTVRDTAGATSTATLTVTVQGANDAPVAVDDAGSASLGSDGGPANDATGNVLDNDTDVDSGDTRTVTALTGGTVGSALAGQYGSLTLNADGSYTYVIDELDPAVVALGPTDSISETFTYTMRDTAGATDTAVLTITVFGANESPTAVADVGTAVEAGVAAGANATGNVLTNDTDPDAGDSQTVTQVKFGATTGVLGSALAGAYGALTLNADGSYSYVVDNSDAAVNALRTASDTLTEIFTYTMRDTAGATSATTLTITIQGGNDAPVAVADVGTAVEVGVSAGSNATGNVLANDTDVDAGDGKTVSALTGGSVGSALAGAYGSLTLNADGSYAYVVNNANSAVQALRTAAQTLTESFTYTVTDTAGATSSTTLTLTIQGANDAPVAVADVGAATEAGTAAGTNASGNVLTNDTDVDSGDAKTVSALTGGAVGSALSGTYGALTLNADGSYSYAVDNANVAVNALRTNADTLTDVFTYTVTDTAGATSSTTLTITVRGANDAPVAVADTGAAVEAGTAAGSNATGNVLTNDTDVDAGDGKTVSAVTGGTVGSALAGAYGSLTLNADGTYSYAVDNGNNAVQALRTAGQTLTDSFTYTVRDTAGATSSTTLTITLQGANDAPVAVADSGSATEAGVAAGANGTGNVLTNDTDVDSGDAKTVSALSGGTVGSASAGAYGSLTLNADGTYSYAVDNGNAAVDALAAGQTLTDVFSYTVTDTAGATSATTLTITVSGANDAPVAVNDSGSATEAGVAAGANATGNVLTNDTDVDSGDSRTVSALGGGAVGAALAGTYGALTLNADGSYSYVVDNANAAVNALRQAADTLTDSFTYTVRDAAGATSTATLTVTVHGANDAPIAVDDSGAASKDGNGVPIDATGNVLTNDTDVDAGDTKTVTALDGGVVGSALAGGHGTLTLQADGAYTYVTDESDPAVLALGPTDSLTETFTYTVTDAAGATDTAVLTITVYGANEAPVAVADVATAVEAGVVAGINPTGNVLTNDTDEDAGDTQEVTQVQFGATAGTLGSALAGAYGALTLNADGSYSYVVDNANAAVGALRTAGDTLTETFSYTMRDAVGITSSTTLTITLQGANDAPLAGDDLGSATDGGPNGSGNVLTND